MFERQHGICNVFQHEADKDMIETVRFEQEVVDISLVEGDVCDPFLSNPILCPFLRNPLKYQRM